MQEELPSDIAFDYPKDTEDLTNVCRLSTILVATIQDVKDRVSQIEFIFCSQLFPNFQSRSKHLQRLEDVMRSAEGEWKKKEKSMLSQIEQLLVEKKNADVKIQQMSSTLEQNGKRLADTEKLAEENEIEKMHLIHKLQSQAKNEDAICQLKDQLKEKNIELEEEKESKRRLIEEAEAEAKVQNFLLEQSKKKELFENYNRLKTNYKQLKSQYLFLVNKMFQNNGAHEIDRMTKEDSPKPYQSKRTLQDSDEKYMEIPKFTSNTSPHRTELVSNEKNEVQMQSVIRPNKRLNADSLINNLSSSSPKKNISADMKSVTGPKISGSLWRDTRTCQRQQDGDPHDDFLDTPMEIVKDFGKRPCEEAQDIPSPPPQDMDFNTDDETQDINIKNNAKPSHTTLHDQGAKIVPKPQKISVLNPANKGFKYIEPVRKKSERENLKGVQCQQCKKFYEAVLPDGGGKENNPRDFFCEHHDGVSRHRYRYAPPMTPEGFWNIGFDSES